ncbi:MAG TPA: ABC transporter substrate-binding protein [Methylomirabilota bacterium]|nr:ABC transporter substrate-binding protein [Methylomirabilota bacterium]
MRYRVSLLFVFLASLLLLPLAPARAGEVTEQLKLDVSRMFDTVQGGRRDRRVSDEGRALLAQMFDWDEMGQRALGRYWRERTEDEREQFLRLFRGLVEAQIVGLGRVNATDIQYVAESVQADTAAVDTRVPSGPGREMQLEYRLQRRDGRWLVYDVLVNHLSLLNHYRAQFQQIIKVASYSGLIEKLSGPR